MLLVHGTFNDDVVYILTCYVENHLLMMYQSFSTNLQILIFYDVANH